MKIWNGWAMPDSETHLVDWMHARRDIRHGRPTYQAHKYDVALSVTRRRRTAVDIGANIGTWSFLMCHDFAGLHAFEPVEAFAQCWRVNVPRGQLHQLALGEKTDVVSMVSTTAGSCGDTTVDVGQAGIVASADMVDMRTLDSFGLQQVDLIKCDNEGYELFVMRGAEQTIRRCRPTIVVEQKPGHGATFGLSDTAAVDFLKSLGMQVQAEISGDYILTF